MFFHVFQERSFLCWASLFVVGCQDVSPSGAFGADAVREALPSSDEKQNMNAIAGKAASSMGQVSLKAFTEECLDATISSIDGAMLKLQASAQSNNVRFLPKGTAVYVLDVGSTWVFVETLGQEGFVAASHLSCL